MEKEYHIYFQNDTIVFIGSPLDAEAHRHYAIQLSFGLERAFRIKYSGDEWHMLDGTIIPSNCTHQYDGTSGMQLIILVNPLSKTGRFICERLIERNEVTPLASASLAGLSDCFRRILGDPRDDSAIRSVLDFFTPGPEHPFEKMDGRIQAVLELFDQLEEKVISLKELASRVGLSESRLLHLFKKEVGNSLRRHLLWLRTLASIRYIIEDGMSFTDACLMTGFTDSAHFSHTFKEMFGVTPSEIAKNSRFIQA